MRLCFGEAYTVVELTNMATPSSHDEVKANAFMVASSIRLALLHGDLLHYSSPERHSCNARMPHVDNWLPRQIQGGHGAASICYELFRPPHK